MATPLATVDDATVRIGRQLDDTETARLEALLSDASARIRSYLGAAALDYPARGEVVESCKVRPGGLIRLGLVPVVSIDSVYDYAVDTPLPFTRYGTAGAVVGVAHGAVINLPETDEEVMPYVPASVKVTYTAGYDPVPDIVVAVCCQAAIRAMQQYQPIQPNAAGGAAFSAPPPGGVWLMSDEKTALDQAVPRPPVGPISMYGPTAPEPLR